jgi:predicted component of type VI protein secretion system
LQPTSDPASIGARVIVHNEVDGRTSDLLFKQFPIRIGRNPMNELVLSHQYVSQWHAVIGISNGVVVMTQVGSSNSVQIGERRLRPNEVVTLGGEEMVRIAPFVLHLQLVALPPELREAPPISTQSVYSSDDGPASEQELLERTALKVWDRLGERYLGHPPQDAHELASFASRVEAALGVFLRYFVALQKGQEQFRQAVDIRALGSGGRSVVERAAQATELAALLFGGPAENIHALEQAFKNVMLHQVALINGLMAGVRSLLARLSPKAVSEEAAREHRSPSPKLLWQTYEQIHRDLAEEDTETFETIFGPQFGRAYSDLVGMKARKSKKR